MPNFFMLVGLPGSGKSTLAAKLGECNCEVLSSDAIREELTGDITNQEHNDEVFETIFQRSVTFLNDGNDVVVDACNINGKERMAFLRRLRQKLRPDILDYLDLVCIVLAVPLDICLLRNAKRARVVPQGVIYRMLKHFTVPYYHEGWDAIKVFASESLPVNPELYDIPQDNPHHDFTIWMHCQNTGLVMERLLEERGMTGEEFEPLLEAAYLHDIGKRYTKSFTDTKGNETSVAHYYQHHCAGAYESLCLKGCKDVLMRAFFIQWHMQPFFCDNEKTEKKYRTMFGDALWDSILLLHQADKTAQTNENFENFFTERV